MKRLRSSWHAVLTGVLMMLLCVVTRNIFIQMQKEQASRSFFLSKEPKKWEKACRRSLNMGPDMAVVLDAEDQAFLNNMMFHSAWIGLQDMAMEGNFFWVTPLASWDNGQVGQDCVAIVPPASTEKQDWLNSWDDTMCAGEQHYLCETRVL
uniref:C-type lectin domain-containing protein n=1 Tax=Sparus aurata TaxID=8175 RepID=A0A671WHJ6_SPAAU